MRIIGLYSINFQLNIDCAVIINVNNLSLHLLFFLIASINLFHYICSLWVFRAFEKFEEVGTMNFFFIQVLFNLVP
jgi:hypothetical protein